MTPLYPQKLALISPTGGGRSVGIVRVRTKATEFSLYIYVSAIVGLLREIVSPMHGYGQDKVQFTYFNFLATPAHIFVLL